MGFKIETDVRSIEEAIGGAKKGVDPVHLGLCCSVLSLGRTLRVTARVHPQARSCPGHDGTPLRAHGYGMSLTSGVDTVDPVSLSKALEPHYSCCWFGPGCHNGSIPRFVYDGPEGRDRIALMGGNRSATVELHMDYHLVMSNLLSPETGEKFEEGLRWFTGAVERLVAAAYTAGNASIPSRTVRLSMPQKRLRYGAATGSSVSS